MNESRNVSYELLKLPYVLPASSKSFLYLAYTITFVVGTSTNVSVIYFLGYKHRFVKRFDVYLVSLATTDLLSSIFLPIITLHDVSTEKTKWHLFRNAGCKIFSTALPLTTLVSSIMLVLIATARLRVIKSSAPMPKLRFRTIIETLLVWTFAVMILVPQAIFVSVTPKGCIDVHWDSHSGYYIAIEVLICILPLISMVVAYTASSYFILNKRLPAGNQRISKKRRQQYKNITRMFLALVGVFIVCTVPQTINNFIMYQKRHHENHHSSRTEILIENGFRILMAIQYCVNPYIYSKMHHNLGKYFNRLKKNWYKLRVPQEDQHADGAAEYSGSIMSTDRQESHHFSVARGRGRTVSGSSHRTSQKDIEFVQQAIYKSRQLAVAKASPSASKL